MITTPSADFFRNTYWKDFLRLRPSGPLLNRLAVCVAVAVLVSTTFLYADTEPAELDKTPDVIVFTNGDQLSGRFLRSTDTTVTFHSDMAGDVNVDWSKVKELRSSKDFAVLPKGQKINRKDRVATVPRGAITVADGNIQVKAPGAAGATSIVPIKNTANVLDSQTFDKEIVNHRSLFHAWGGTITGGSTVVQATQNSTTFHGAVALLRAVPTVPYLPARSRTTVTFSGSYGKITEPGYPEVKTEIYHADAERDQYFSNRFFALAQVIFDHNFSQSLDLQQIYGGGIGWTAINQSRQHLDFKTTIQYEKQEFANATAGTNQDLIGSTISATYKLKMPRNMLFSQQVNYLPAYNNVRAYSVNETNTLLIPFYKRLSFTLGTIESYLNNPPATVPPTKRNSFQFNTGISYSLTVPGNGAK